MRAYRCEQRYSNGAQRPAACSKHEQLSARIQQPVTAAQITAEHLARLIPLNAMQINQFEGNIVEDICGEAVAICFDRQLTKRLTS